MHPQQWLEPLEPIFTWLPHSNMYPIVLYNYHYLSRRRKNYILLLLYFLSLLLLVLVLYTHC